MECRKASGLKEYEASALPKLQDLLVSFNNEQSFFENRG